MYLAAATMLKMEPPHFLREWLAYHQQIGVERFWIYVNEDNPAPTMDLLHQYPNVEAIHLPGVCKQPTMYADVMKRAKWKTRWLTMSDLDEFWRPVGVNTLPEVLQDYEDFPGLAANWLVFGTSGCVQRPPSQVRCLTRRSQTAWGCNMHMKCIVDPSQVESWPSPHHCTFRRGRVCVNENLQAVASPFMPHSMRRLVVNHYMVRSREDLETRYRRGRPDMPDGKKFHSQDEAEAYFREADRNEVQDTDLAERFGARLP